METIKLERKISANEAEKLKGKQLDDNSYDTIINKSCDAYDLNGKLLFKYRKNAIPMEILKSGYDAFKGSIASTDGRGTAAGGNFKRIRKDGTVSNISIAKKVLSGNVGYMDAGAMVHYCRRTAFARDHFDKFKEGIPFVEFINKKYEEYCPAYYTKQMAIAKGTNRNYKIGETCFTTVTVNENFPTAVHKDSGDYQEGFGNLIVYREGDYKGSYFCLPEYRAAIDMQNCDLLFADVHRWHGNTPFNECSEDYKRIAFVLYYRENMYKCKQPSEELAKVKMEKNGFFTTI